jgi:hypothetical protein
MTPKKAILTAAMLALPVAAFGYTRVGFGFNFGFPIYDYPAPQRVVVVQQPVPTEVPPASAPAEGLVWVSGHYEWDTPGNRWVWYGATWQRPPAPNAVWQAGYWSQQGNSWLWVHSHWAVPNAAPSSSNAAPAQPPPPAPQNAPQPQPEPAPAASGNSSSSSAAPATTPPPPVVVNEAPPAPVVEEIYTAPGPDYVWVGGAWAWNGAWVWAPGHYARPPYHGAVWVGGKWSHGPRGYVWAGGRWR